MTDSARKLVIAILACVGSAALICGGVILSIHQFGAIFGGNLLLCSFLSGVINTFVFLYLSWSVRSFIAAVVISSFTMLLVYASPRSVNGGFAGVIDDFFHPLALLASLVCALVLTAAVTAFMATISWFKRANRPGKIDETP